MPCKRSGKSFPNCEVRFFCNGRTTNQFLLFFLPSTETHKSTRDMREDISMYKSRVSELYIRGRDAW